MFQGVMRRVMGPCLRPLASSTMWRAAALGPAMEAASCGRRVARKAPPDLTPNISHAPLEPITKTQGGLGSVEALAVIADQPAEVAIARIEIDEQLVAKVVPGTEPDIAGEAVTLSDRRGPPSDEAEHRMIQVGPGVTRPDDHVGDERPADEPETRNDVPLDIHVEGCQCEIGRAVRHVPGSALAGAGGELNAPAVIEMQGVAGAEIHVLVEARVIARERLFRQ